MLRDAKPPIAESKPRGTFPETIARVRNAERPGERRWVDLVSLVEEAVDAVSTRATVAGVDVAFMWTVPGVVRAERAPFVAALRALLGVSIDATERGGRVGVHLYAVDGLVLEVRYGRRKRVSEMRSPRWLDAIEGCRREVEPLGGALVVDLEDGSPAAVKVRLPFH